ncbi:pyridoxamine 5'-phosphate oxidase family protein [Aquipuribacter sp. MA13-6]|uniref:pyridoxamine 5'-phosphate oxidase family protein n=1 Tax=unclassified Aquipuribacter TaxID=2635084 RepID=UPI003EEDC73A
MADPRGVEELESGTCWALLAASEVSRLAVVVDSAPEIFPVNHAVLGQRVLMRTAAGTKLFAAVGRDVAVEVDGVDDEGRAWSVVAKGPAVEVEDEAGRRAVDERLDVWLESRKEHVLAVEVAEMTGRRFAVRQR